MTLPDRELDQLQRALTEAPGGAGCASPDTIWQAVTGKLDPEQATALLDHSASCGCCAQAWVLAWELNAEASAQTASPALPFPSRLAWTSRHALALAAGIVLVAGTVLLVRYQAGLPGRREPRVAGGATPGLWQQLPVEPAPFSDPGADGRVWRGNGVVVPPSALDAFRLAMRPYAGGDFLLAAARLEKLVAAHPELREARFFLGVSLLLTGHSGDAAAHLGQVVDETGQHVVPEHRWYLALALLKADRPENALRQLDLLQQQGGPYASRAAELGAQVRALAGAEP